MDADLTCPECDGSGVHECEFVQCPKRGQQCHECDGVGRRRPHLAEYDNVVAERDRLRVEYVPPPHWPADAWDPLLDAYFAADGDTARFGNYVLMRIPDEIADRIDAARAALDREDTT